jgi:asparagine synthetase B (glutamine-hydrolysing)
MCGIGGFSLSKNSKINARKLSNALLTELDVRGNQASGFSYQLGTEQGVFKKDTSGSMLNLKAMPRDAEYAILHTRFATHGTITDMANNHPIQSPDKSIDLVHNGVIYNHDLLRKELQFKLPEVDTSVIPALLQQFERNTDKFSMLDGDASVAWLDRKDTGVLRVARISHSPLTVAQVKDGSFVFASTKAILLKSLNRVGLRATYIEEIGERTLLTIKFGRIIAQDILPALDPEYADKTVFNYSSYRSMTSGAYPQSCPTPESGIKVMESLWGDVVIPSSWFDDEALPEFPEIDGLFVNSVGEYFDSSGYFVGDVDDMYDMGFFDNDSKLKSWDDWKVNVWMQK